MDLPTTSYCTENEEHNCWVLFSLKKIVEEDKMCMLVFEGLAVESDNCKLLGVIFKRWISNSKLFGVDLHLLKQNLLVKFLHSTLW